MSNRLDERSRISWHSERQSRILPKAPLWTSHWSPKTPSKATPWKRGIRYVHAGISTLGYPGQHRRKRIRQTRRQDLAFGWIEAKTQLRPQLRQNTIITGHCSEVRTCHLRLGHPENSEGELKNPLQWETGQLRLQWVFLLS